MNEIRLLHRNSQYGYTARMEMALMAEPEAISETEQAELSDRSRSLFEIARAEELAKAQTRSRCNRLRELEIEARRKAIDPTRALSHIERGLALLELMVRGTALRGTAAA